MSNVIQYLEALARLPRGVDTGQREVLAAMEPDTRVAIAAGDVATLARLLDARPTMACMIVAPDAEEPEQQDEPGDAGEAPDEQEVRAA